MKKLLSLLALSLILSSFLTGCGPDEEETEEETEVTEEEVAVEERPQEMDVTGIWSLTIGHGGGVIQNTIFIYPLGLAQTVSGLVTLPEGIVMNPGISGAYWADYEVNENQLTMVAQNGSSTSNGTLLDENNASGTITSAAGTYAWTATKTGELPDDYGVLGYWMMHIDGWGEGEFSRFQSLYLNADGTADTDWVKVQTDDGQVNEGEIPDYLSTFTYQDSVVFIESENGNLTFQGTYNGDGVIEGVWHNSATNETGTFEAIKMD
jgi:hypothetical protein